MNRRLLSGGALFATVAFALSACVNGIPLEVRVTQERSGSSVLLHRGQELVVELQRSSDTDFVWRVVSNGPAVLDQPVKQVLQLSGQSVVTERYIFTTMRVGEDTVRIAEVRQDGMASPARREFVLSVSVVD